MIFNATCSMSSSSKIIEHMGGPRGGGNPLMENHKNIVFFCLPILVRIPLKSQSYQASIQCWAIIAKRHLNGVSQAGRWWPANSGIWLLLSLIKLNLKLKKNIVRVGPDPHWQNFLDPRMHSIEQMELIHGRTLKTQKMKIVFFLHTEHFKPSITDW